MIWLHFQVLRRKLLVWQCITLKKSPNGLEKCWDSICTSYTLRASHLDEKAMRKEIAFLGLFKDLSGRFRRSVIMYERILYAMLSKMISRLFFVSCGEMIFFFLFQIFNFKFGKIHCWSLFRCLNSVLVLFQFFNSWIIFSTLILVGEGCCLSIY